jgi:hypothetical protein
MVPAIVLRDDYESAQLRETIPWCLESRPMPTNLDCEHDRGSPCPYRGQEPKPGATTFALAAGGQRRRILSPPSNGETA